jgi:lysyl endopeptidase
MMDARIVGFFGGALLALAAVPGIAFAAMTEAPKSFSLRNRALDSVEQVVLEPIDPEQLLAEDRGRAKLGASPGPLRFAVSENVEVNLRNSGTWSALPDGRLWRLRIRSPGAISNNLGFSRFELGEGAKLWIYDPDGKHVEGPFTARNRNNKGGLWTPIIRGEEIVIELFVPTESTGLMLILEQVNKGYRGLGKEGVDKSGSCNNDVVCPEGNPWTNEIHSVARYSINGTGFCSGQLMNNTAIDFRPFFLSANHCGVSTSNDHTLVFYWNFESPNCGDLGGGSLAENQTGATFRAAYAASDFLLVELDAAPVAANAYFSGWDASGSVAASTVGIHHPSADEKAISFNTNAVTSTAYYSNSTSATANHWRVDDWEDGTTEGGSSGSCLWDTSTRRCVGQLHGGDASCSAATSPDWYGKLSVSWDGGGTSATRLRDWLDPGNTGATSLHGDPHVTTMDGTHYYFQGAGEYVVLRDSGVAEVQVRQAPIATTFNPGPDSYHGLATCVSLNTAVAVRVGERRVSYQPNLSGVPDPSGLQLRVDGAVTTLGPNGIDLGNGGRISPASAPGSLEITFPERYALQVTPGWWASQSKWYLNVGVVRVPTAGSAGASPGKASNIGGLGGPIAQKSWLPALPDGTSLGPMPASMHDRYVGLYGKFGDAWRVTNATSLFDYAPGTSTSTFTMGDWPRERPPCTLPDVRPVEPTSLEVAQDACAAVRNQKMRADCVFDVRVTGETGFADTYLRTEGFTTGSEGRQLRDYQCYRVDKPTSQSERLMSTVLNDQFGSSKSRLGRITKICTPLSKDNKQVADEEPHLVCYETLDRTDPQRPVVTTNQFGAAQMYVREAQELCVPSTKKVME